MSNTHTDGDTTLSPEITKDATTINLSTTPTENAWLDEVFEVRIADDQKGYLWAKLSPKSKATILAHIDTVCREAVKEALDYYAWRFECNTAISEMYGWKGTLETAKEQTLKHFEATLNVNTKDTE